MGPAPAEGPGAAWTVADSLTLGPSLLSQPEPGSARWGKVRLKQGQRETVLCKADGEGGLDSADLTLPMSAAPCACFQTWK